MVENLFQIVTKSHALAPHRYSLVLLKVGCPVGCSEWLPVSKAFFDECVEGEMIQLSVKRVNMTVDESHKYVAAHKTQRVAALSWKNTCGTGSSCGIEEYQPS